MKLIGETSIELTAAEKIKLSGIEISATADQTASDIRSLIGTGNNNLVPAAGSSGDFLKHDGTFGTPSYTSDTNTQLSNAEVRAAVEAASDSNVFTDADHTKLNSLSVSLTPNYSLISSSGTTTTSATDGEANAVVIPYDTEDLVSSTNTVILTGSDGIDGVSGSTYAWYSATQGDWEYQWNVLSNTNIANNRILSGVKLQRGTHNDSTMTWTDYDPSTSFIYDRGTGSIRKGSTTNQTLVTQAGTQYYWRLVVWKEESSHASTTAITVVTGVSLIVKQIS